MIKAPLIKGDMISRPKNTHWPGRGRFFLPGLIYFLFSTPIYAVNITGSVRDLGGNPIQNVEIYIQGQGIKDVTSSTGAYVIAGLDSGGNYVVYAAKTGMVFTPATRTYINLTVDQADQEFVYGKVWSGAGADNLASNTDNWVGGETPVANDAVLFSSTGQTKSCFWDTAVNITSFTIAVDYSSAIIPTTGMDLVNLTIQGGEIQFGILEHNISGHFAQEGGTFTFGPTGRINFDGTSPQNLGMVVGDQGNGIYTSFFTNLWIKGTSTVTLTSDVIVDGAFNVNAGAEFQTQISTFILTGGRLSGAGPGSSYNWSDDQGSFKSGSGGVRFFNHPRGYRVSQSASNAFNNLTIDGDAAVDLNSNIKVLGTMRIGQADRSSQLNTGNPISYQLDVYGSAFIGPCANPLANALDLGNANAIFRGDVTIGTATVSLTDSNIAFRGSSVTVTSQGVIRVQSGNWTTLSFFDQTLFNVTGGTFATLSNTILQSTAPGVTRFGMQFNGAIDIQQSMTINSPDGNGMKFGLGSNPMNLNYITFQNGITGGAALNFDPVTVASVTVTGPVFDDTTISTNIRGILDPGVLSNADINIIDPTGVHSGPDYENDPDNIINWGVLGTPSNFQGSPMGTSSITWTWTIANEPLGFTVKDGAGTPVSPILGPNISNWIETSLSTNTAYTRYVEAYSDLGTAGSNTTARYTYAVPVTSAAFSQVEITSITVSWTANTNPPNTIFILERSQNGTDFTGIATGTLAGIQPFNDQNLSADVQYWYRLNARNGDNVLTSAITISTTTEPVPPPIVTGITPNSGQNLGSISFTVRGSYFQEGASLILRRSPTQFIIPTTLTRVNSSTFTGTISLLGAYAAPWDVYVQNLDGTISGTSGSGLFIVNNAVSQGDITIRDYNPILPLNFFTTDSLTEIRVPAGTMGAGRFYVSVDPLTSPLLINPADILSQVGAGWTLIPGSIREALAYGNTGRQSGVFNKSITLSIYYPDSNNDGIVDSITIRASTLKMMTLSSSTGLWEPVPGSIWDSVNKRITATTDHFSVFALFGSPAAEDLSQVKIYPNPWKPLSATKFDSDTLIISGLTREGTVRIFTIDAQFVRELPYSLGDAGILTWDGKNENGQKVGSGIYLVHIKSGDGEKKILKLGIER